MLLLDTNFVSAFVEETRSRRAGPAMSLLRSRPGERLVISLITIGEYLEYVGAPRSALETLRMASVVGLSLDIARRCALLQSRLTRRLGENDAWIAATALHHDFDLVSADRDFERVPRLRLIRFDRA